MIALFAAGSLLATTATSAADQTRPEKIVAAQSALSAHLAYFQQKMGVDGAADLTVRLESDLADVEAQTPPDGYPAAEWNERVDDGADLDVSIVTQVLSGAPAPLAGSRGLVERLLTSRIDGTLQPVAVYVPPNLGRNPSLVVLLHGRPQTESEILGAPQFRRLADATGTIIAAPYGRSFYDFAGVAADDVYQAADEAVSAFHIDPHHVFLVGYSMGGFSVFKIGPTNATRWAGIMCIAGAILNSEATAVRFAFRNTPNYVVNGSNDQVIPPQYGEMTAQFLAGVGIPTGFYQEPGGTHFVPTLVPALSSAWNDMLAGVVRNTPSTTIGAVSLNVMPQLGGKVNEP